MASPNAFDANVELTAGDLSDLNRITGDLALPVPVQGQIEAKADVKGQLENAKWQANGSLRSRQLAIDKVRVSSISADIAADPKALELKQFAMHLEGGSLTGNGTVPLSSEGAGNLQFGLEKVDIGRLVQQYADLQIPIQGVVSGSATATSPAPAAGTNRHWAVKANYQIPTISVASVQAGNLQGGLTYENQRLDYNLQGKVFEGDFELRGELPPPQSAQPVEEQKPNPVAPGKPPQSPLPGQGTLKLEDLDLQKAVQAFQGAMALRDVNLSGILNLTLTWSQNPAEASGTVLLTDVVWKGERISDRLAGTVRLGGNDLVFVTMDQGSIAGADYTADVRWGLGTNNTRDVHVTFRRLSVPFIAKVTPFPEGLVEGDCNVDARIHPHRGRLWRRGRSESRLPRPGCGAWRFSRCRCLSGAHLRRRWTEPNSRPGPRGFRSRAGGCWAI